jgi:hypothetical protein
MPPQAPPSTRAAGAKGTKTAPAQPLECTPGPLRRLHPQRRSAGGALWARAPVGTPADTAAPAQRTDQAQALALGKPCTTQRDPAGGTERPRARSLSPCGQHLFDNLSRQHTR